MCLEEELDGSRENVCGLVTSKEITLIHSTVFNSAFFFSEQLKQLMRDLSTVVLDLVKALFSIFLAPEFQGHFPFSRNGQQFTLEYLPKVTFCYGLRTFFS